MFVTYRVTREKSPLIHSAAFGIWKICIWNFYMENQYRIIVHCYVAPKTWHFWPVYLPFRSLAGRYAMTPLFLLFSLTSRVTAHQMVQKKKKEKDSRGASFTFEAATAISTIRPHTFIFSVDRTCARQCTHRKTIFPIRGAHPQTGAPHSS